MVSNKTQQPIYDPETHLYSQTSILILKGFQPGQVYRFYCVRESIRGLYSRSVDVTCYPGSNFNGTIIAKSAAIEQSGTSRHNTVGEITFIPMQIPRSIPWRNDESIVYSSGIRPGESYRILCNVRHRANRNQPISVFIQHYQCPIANCLSDLLDKQCQSPDRNTIKTTKDRVDDQQIQVVSSGSHQIDNPAMGHQYLCCDQKNGFTNLAKAIAVQSRKIQT